MFRFQSCSYDDQRGLGETQPHPGVLPTWIPGRIQIPATNRQVIGEHVVTTSALRLPANIYGTYSEFTDVVYDQELSKSGRGSFANASIEAGYDIPERFPDANMFETNLPEAEGQRPIPCNSPNLIDSNGLTESGVYVPVLTDTFADIPPPGDFDSRSKWNLSMPDPSLLADPPSYHNGTYTPLPDFQLSPLGEGNQGARNLGLSNTMSNDLHGTDNSFGLGFFSPSSELIDWQLSPLSAQVSAAWEKSMWSNEVHETYSSSMPEEVLPSGLSPFPKLGPNRTNIQDSENLQAETLASSCTASLGVINQLGGITENPKRTNSIRSGSNSINRLAKSTNKKRGRHGHLPPNKAEHAHKMRHLGACMLCNLEKVTCSAGKVCERCRASDSLSMGGRLCIRAKFQDYARLFQPSLLVSQLEESAVEKLTQDMKRRFTDHQFDVELTCGLDSAPLGARVTEFALVSDSAASTSVVVKEGRDERLRFHSLHMAPVALRMTEQVTVKWRCLSYVKSMAKKQKEMRSIELRPMHPICRQLLLLISHYNAMQPPSRTETLLDKAFNLYSMHYFMGTSIRYSKSCADRLVQCLRAPTSRSWETSYISGLLNTQLKSTMSTLLQESTREVLDKLERELKKKSKSLWSSCFSTICLLFVCAEEVQIATQGLIMHNIAHGSGIATSSIDGVETCKSLDDRPFTHLMGMFHLVYNSRKLPMAHRPDHVFNPLRDGIQAYNQEDLDQGSQHLVNGVRQLIFQNWTELLERARTPSFDSAPENLDQYVRFRDRNSGRLISKFLLSFQPQ